MHFSYIMYSLQHENFCEYGLCILKVSECKNFNSILGLLQVQDLVTPLDIKETIHSYDTVVTILCVLEFLFNFNCK
jgi:hypothetical protein